MTLTLTLTPEKESRLSEQARAKGLSLDDYVQVVVDRAVVETDEKEQARLNQAWDALLLEAQSLQPVARNKGEKTTTEQSHDDAIVEKYRRQGFNL